MHRLVIVRYALGASLLLAGIVLWLPASDVVNLVLEQEPVLLGRYSLKHFGSLLLVSFLLWLPAGLLFSRRRFDRELGFQVITITGSTVLGVLLVFILSRLIIPPRYEAEAFTESRFYQTMVEKSAGAAQPEAPPGSIVHRKPGLKLGFTYADVPRAARSYPNAPPGYPAVSGMLTTDNRGFRNRQALTRADVVAIGDSFTEGNQVSDEDAWPEVLARHSRLSVYNLGVSLMAPQEYLNNFITYGLALKPRLLILMFYEGNDFVREDHSFPLKKERLLQDSPLGSALRNLLLNSFGSINADAPLPPHPALSWVPAVVNANGSAQYYAFGPGRIHSMLYTPEELMRAPEWPTVTRILRQLHQVARENNIRFILGYAPTNAHVVLPLIRNALSDEALHAFTAAKKKRHPLLPATGFRDYVFARIDTKENALREFCRAEGIEFVSMTPILRARMAAGEQVYYTYDSHWTPPGQRAAGMALAQYLQASNPGFAPASTR